MASGGTNGTAKKTTIVIGLLLLTLAVVYIFITASVAFLLLFAAVLFALLLDGCTNFVLKYIKIKRSLALGIVVLLLFGFLGGTFYLIGEPIVEQTISLFEQLPKIIEKLKSSLQETEWGRTILAQIPSADSMPAGKEVVGYITTFFSGLFTIISNAAIVIIVGLYLAIHPELYINNLLLVFPRGRREQIDKLFHQWGKALKWWLAGRIASMIIVGVLTAIGLFIIGIPLALSLSFIAAFLSFIPFIGPIIAFIPAILVGFAQSPVTALYVAIVYIIIQTIESYMLTPLIEQYTVSLPPALVITMQVVFGFVFGLMGVFLADPITVVIIIAVQILYEKPVIGEEVGLLGDRRGN